MIFGKIYTVLQITAFVIEDCQTLMVFYKWFNKRTALSKGIATGVTELKPKARSCIAQY